MLKTFKIIAFLVVATLWSGLAGANDKIDAARKIPQYVKGLKGSDYHEPIARLVEETRGALVYIINKSIGNQKRSGDSSASYKFSSGSGFFIDLQEGYVVTNHHVIGSSRVDLRLKLANGEEYRAKVVGSSPEVDIAVLKIANSDFDRDDLKELAFADETHLGEIVIALGAPFGLQESVTMGIISGINRSGNNLVQTDAAINGGNSGGPLINIRGQVVGVNAMKIAGYAADNVGFAVSASTAKIVSERIIEQGYFRYSYLGIYLQELHTDMRDSFKLPQDVDGVLITKFADEDRPTPLQVGDAIVAVNDTIVTTPAEVATAVKFLPPNSKVELRLYREGQEMTVEVLAREYQKMGIPTVAGATGGIWGVTLEEHVSSVDRKKKIEYLLVKHNRNLRTDLAAGDRVIAADNITIASFKWLKSYLKGREKVVLHVQRGERKFYIVMNK